MKMNGCAMIVANPPPDLDERSALRAALARFQGAVLLNGDGWAIAAERVPKPPSRVLLLIDPPYERGDDVEQAIRLSQIALKRNPKAVIAIWAPIKDLAGFDTLITTLADAAAPAQVMVAEVRLRPLSDPMKMNGCAMIVANPPPDLDERSAQAAVWIARTLGESGGSGRVERLASTS